MMLTSPFWLILAIPLAISFWLFPFPGRTLAWLRGVSVVLLLLALSGLSLILPARRGCVVVVADRSLSMPSGSDGQQMEVIELLQRGMGSDDELAVVSFGQRVTVEQPPQKTRFPGFVTDVGKEASNLSEAVDRALSLLPAGRSGRILILSDGHATGSDVAAATARAASSGIGIDYRSLQRPGVGDLLIERIDAPGAVAAEDAFLISAWVHSPLSQTITYDLMKGDERIASGEKAVPQGRSRLMFRDKASDTGSRSYSLVIRSQDSDKEDPIRENNQARFYVGVRGNQPVLCVGAAESSLPELLQAGGVKVVRKTPGEVDWSLGELSGYSAVLLEDVAAGKVGTRGMETLAAWVSETGAGLLMTGGRNSYGTGGYFKSPLEPILPVSMELRQEHRKLSLAIVVALDRSGSMTASVSGGKRKIDLANIATAEVLSQLSGNDQFGCLAVDSIAHEIVPLSGLANKSAMESQILKIDSMGGGIFVYEALEKAAAMIAPATAGTKHIILFSDAADSEEPGNYADLLEKCLQAGITVSVIGLGTEFDSDAELLKDVARRGGGQCMFTEDANELPRLFAQDTFMVSRSTFIEEPTSVRPTAGLRMISSANWNEFPSVGGYNLCYLRPEANLGGITQDEYEAPLVASWQSGTGRVLCYTGEADGKYSGAFAGWPEMGAFYTSLARWVSPQDQGLGPDLLLTQDIRQGVARIQLHLDSERESTPFTTTPTLTLLKGNDGEKPEGRRVPLTWTGADLLTAEVPLYGGETLLTSLDLPGIGQTTLPPTRLPYSAEFALPGEGSGLPTLERMAKGTGGIERVNLASIWNDLPRTPQAIPLAPWLLLAAMLLLLLEVLHRRTGLLAFRRSNASFQTDVTDKRPAKSKRIPPSRKQETAASVPQPGSSPTASAPVPPVSSPDEQVSDALAQARNRAARRTQR